MIQERKRKVLVVEDEREIRDLIVLHLERHGFEAATEADGELAHRRLQKETFDLLILDWMLPSLSGLELMRLVRRAGEHRRCPILFVTAKAQTEQIVMALDSGADDYLVKPFEPSVLVARAEALLRRGRWLEERPPMEGFLRLGAMVLDTNGHTVTVEGRRLDLTRSEFRLLHFLVQNQGKVLSRKEIVERIQGEDIHVIGRTVDTHIFGLRKKLGDHGGTIETIRGVGYRIAIYGN